MSVAVSPLTVACATVTVSPDRALRLFVGMYAVSPRTVSYTHLNALFAVLAILGIVTDPTTAGVGDSAQALTYTEPKRYE